MEIESVASGEGKDKNINETIEALCRSLVERVDNCGGRFDNVIIPLGPPREVEYKLDRTQCSTDEIFTLSQQEYKVDQDRWQLGVEILKDSPSQPYTDMTISSKRKYLKLIELKEQAIEIDEKFEEAKLPDGELTPEARLRKTLRYYEISRRIEENTNSKRTIQFSNEKHNRDYLANLEAENERLEKIRQLILHELGEKLSF